MSEEKFSILGKDLGRLSDIQQEADNIIRSYWEMEKSSHLEALVTPPSVGVERISLYSFAQKVLGEVKEKASHRDIQIILEGFGIGVTKENRRRLFDGLFHTLDTELYGSNKPYDFGAGGKGLDLLRTKVYSKRFGFDISVASQRCLYLPTDRDLCSGRIFKCPHCRAREDCFNSGGSTFCLTFTVAGG